MELFKLWALPREKRFNLPTVSASGAGCGAETSLNDQVAITATSDTDVDDIECGKSVCKLGRRKDDKD